MATIERITYARVAKGAVPGAARTKQHDSELDRFLTEHFAALRALATRDDAPLSFFISDAPRDQFERLRTGSEQVFLAAAHGLTLALIGEMDNRSAEGLLVCVQVTDDGEKWAAAMKLEVIAPNSAVLDRLESGEEVLSAVTDVMDAPGDLQKGALVMDPRAGSDVVIGDRLSQDALYFPRAFGIRTHQKPTEAASDLVAAIEQRQGTAVAVRAAREMPRLEAAPAREVLEGLGQQIPELDTEAQAAVASALEARPRPVREVNTEAPLKQVIRASGVTVQVPLASSAEVEVTSKAGGGWRITIDVEEEPRMEIRKG